MRLAVCSNLIETKGVKMTDQHDTINPQTLAAFADAWNRHDLNALMAFMHKDCLFHAVAGPDLLGRTFTGHTEVSDGFKAAWTSFPDAAWLDGDHFVAGDRGVSESTFKGTNADGSRIEARMVDVFTFKDGKILVKNAFRKNRPSLVGA
jgi:ketosteroid isomerase-like protein